LAILNVYNIILIVNKKNNNFEKFPNIISVFLDLIKNICGKNSLDYAKYLGKMG
jgi:hypothetical protein